MTRKLRSLPQPSPAMAVALIALFVAMGGPGYAATTVKRALFAKKADRARFASRAARATRANKANTATSAKKAGKVDGFNASAHAIPNTLLALGSDGKFPRSAIPAAPPPAASPVRVVFRRSLSDAVENGVFAEAHVGCATGETLVSGGAAFIRTSDGRIDPRTPLTVSAPVGGASAEVLEDDAAAVQWQAAGRNVSGEPARLLAYAGCAPG